MRELDSLPHSGWGVPDCSCITHVHEYKLALCASSDLSWSKLTPGLLTLALETKVMQ